MSCKLFRIARCVVSCELYAGPRVVAIMTCFEAGLVHSLHVCISANCMSYACMDVCIWQVQRVTVIDDNVLLFNMHSATLCYAMQYSNALCSAIQCFALLPKGHSPVSNFCRYLSK